MTEWTLVDDPTAEFSAGGGTGHKGYTGFKSMAKMIGPNGKEIAVNKMAKKEGRTIPTWKDLPEGMKIQWEVETESDGEGKSDRCSIELGYLDSAYVARITNQEINKMTDAEMEDLIANPVKWKKILIERVTEATEPSQMLKTIYSQSITTNDNGWAKGEIAIPSQWPKGAYSLLFHYGYHAESESGGWGKAFDWWFWNVGVVIIEIIVTMILVGLICAGSVGALCPFAVGAAVFTIVLLVDLSYMWVSYNESAFGLAGLNKYDAEFPVAGWNHAYAFGLETEVAESELTGEISPTNQVLLGAAQEYIEAEGLVMASLMGAIAVAIGLIMVKSIKGGK